MLTYRGPRSSNSVLSCVQTGAETVQYKSGTFHYGFTQDGKDAFLKFLATELTTKDVGCWVQVLEDIRKGLGLSAKSATSTLKPEAVSKKDYNPQRL